MECKQALNIFAIFFSSQYFAGAVNILLVQTDPNSQVYKQNNSE